MQVAWSPYRQTAIWLIDGEAYMSQWADSLAAMGSSETLRSQLLHAGLSLDNVAVRGKTKGGWAALDLIEYAHRRNNVEIFGMVSDHGYYGNAENKETVDWLYQHGVYNVRRNPRYPNLAAGGLCCGSNHQKFACLGNPSNRHALLGSADIHSGRWDTATHASPNSDRPGKPTHEVGVMIQGPAVVDVEATFRERWNDSSRTRLLPDKPFPPVLSGQYGLPLSQSSSPPSGTTVLGPDSVQVLHTYGRTSRGYSWSNVGEFTIWASYLNAILRATSYIYIEDQYFMPFDFPQSFKDRRVRPGTVILSSSSGKRSAEVSRCLSWYLPQQRRKGSYLSSRSTSAILEWTISITCHQSWAHRVTSPLPSSKSGPRTSTCIRN